MAKASQVVILENEFYIIKAPNGKVLEVKDFNTENGAAIQLWSYAGHPWQQWQFVDCLLYTSPSPRDRARSRMPSSA